MNISTDHLGSVLPATTTSQDHLDLAQFERVIEDSLPKFEDVCIALFEIHTRKLYKLNSRSFEAYLKERWRMSRSRGYQMLHYARLKKLSTMVDITCPANERQARKIDADGHSQPDDPEKSGYSKRLRRLTDYLTKQFRDIPPAEKQEFIMDLRELLDQFDPVLKPDQTHDDNENCFLQNEPTDANDSTDSKERPAPDSGLQLAQVDAQTNNNELQKSHPAIDITQVAEQRENSLPVKGFTMEEARKLGLVPRSAST